MERWRFRLFFKTRSLPARACELGRIECNGQGVKAACQIRIGDLLQLKNDRAICATALEFDLKVGFLAMVACKGVHRLLLCHSQRTLNLELSGAPGETRTPDLLVRSQPLYPTELRAHASRF